MDDPVHHAVLKTITEQLFAECAGQPDERCYILPQSIVVHPEEHIGCQQKAAKQIKFEPDCSVVQRHRFISAVNSWEGSVRLCHPGCHAVVIVLLNMTWRIEDSLAQIIGRQSEPIRQADINARRDKEVRRHMPRRGWSVLNDRLTGGILRDVAPSGSRLGWTCCSIGSRC